MGGKNRNLIEGIIVKRLGVSLFFIFVLVAVGIVVFILGIIDIDKSAELAQPNQENNVLFNFPFVSSSELDSWQEKTLSAKNTSYSFVKEDEMSCIKAVSNDSASTLYFRRQLSFSKDPYVSWDWKVTKFPSRKKKETLDKKSEFDFAAQVYVVFHAKFFLNAKAIQYVWTEDLPVGEVSNSPYTKNVKVVVLESGLTNEWKHEYRNVKEDFKELFGEDLKADMEGISFMTDADSTGTSAEAFYTNFEIGILSTQVTNGYFEVDSIKEKINNVSSNFPFVDRVIKNSLLLVDKCKAFLVGLIEKYF